MTTREYIEEMIKEEEVIEAMKAMRDEEELEAMRETWNASTYSSGRLRPSFRKYIIEEDEINYSELECTCSEYAYC